AVRARAHVRLDRGGIETVRSLTVDQRRDLGADPFAEVDQEVPPRDSRTGTSLTRSGGPCRRRRPLVASPRPTPTPRASDPSRPLVPHRPRRTDERPCAAGRRVRLALGLLFFILDDGKLRLAPHGRERRAERPASPVELSSDLVLALTELLSDLLVREPALPL